MRIRFTAVRFAALFLFTMATVWTRGAAMAQEQTIYDAQILARMDSQFTEDQKAEVEKVIERSGKVMEKIFEKYEIDPHAKPDFDKLVAARHELQELEAQEKREMKAIMTRQQFKYYLGLIQTTAANVIRATRNKP